MTARPTPGSSAIPQLERKGGKAGLNGKEYWALKKSVVFFCDASKGKSSGRRRADNRRSAAAVRTARRSHTDPTGPGYHGHKSSRADPLTGNMAAEAAAETVRGLPRRRRKG